jgi:hypothetical protein
MSDLPPLPQNAPYQHPAPPEGWRPMSGMAVTCFVLSLVFILPSIVGFWVVQLLAIALGIYTILTINNERRRGRLLAIWGVVIAVGVGSCSFAFWSGVRGFFKGIATSQLAALSSDVSDEEKDEAMRGWFQAETLEKDPGLLADVRRRYAALVADVGPYRNEIDLGTPLFGAAPILAPPTERLEEYGVAPDERGGLPAAGAWVRARFERGEPWVCFVMMERTNENIQEISQVGSGPMPLLTNVRFFRVAAAPAGP